MSWFSNKTEIKEQMDWLLREAAKEIRKYDEMIDVLEQPDVKADPGITRQIRTEMQIMKNSSFTLLSEARHLLEKL